MSDEPSDNPFESPRAVSAAAANSPHASPPASFLWFAAPAIVANFLGMLLSSVDKVEFTLQSLAAPALIAIVVAFIGSLVYLAMDILFHRKHPATALSRIAAAIVFSLIVWAVAFGFMQMKLQIPPGLVSLPIAAVASFFADRILCRWRGKLPTS